MAYSRDSVSQREAGKATAEKMYGSGSSSSGGSSGSSKSSSPSHSHNSRSRDSVSQRSAGRTASMGSGDGDGNNSSHSHNSRSRDSVSQRSAGRAAVSRSRPTESLSSSGNSNSRSRDSVAQKAAGRAVASKVFSTRSLSSSGDSNSRSRDSVEQRVAGKRASSLSRADKVWKDQPRRSWQQFRDHIEDPDAFGKSQKADRVASGGPSWQQFRDFVDDPSMKGRTDKVSDRGLDWQQFRDFVDDPSMKGRTDKVSDSGPGWQQFRDFVEDGRGDSSNPSSDKAQSRDFEEYGRSSDTGSSPTFEQLTALLGKMSPSSRARTAQDPWNPLDDAVESGQRRRDERAAEGIMPSPGMVDWNGILFDANKPYRDRVDAAGGAPFEGPIDFEGIGAALFGPGGDDVAARDYATWLGRNGYPEGYRPEPEGGRGRGGKRGEPAPMVDPESGFAYDEESRSFYRDDLLPVREDPGVLEITVPGHRPSGPFSGRPDAPIPGNTGGPARLPESEGMPSPFNPLEGLMAGLGAEQRRVSGGMPPLPRRRPDPRGGVWTDGGIAAAVPQPGEGVDRQWVEENFAGESDEARYARENPVTPPSKPTVWDNVVDMGGKLLEHTALGGITKSLFPDLWYGGGEMMKGLDSGSGGGGRAGAFDPNWDHRSMVDDWGSSDNDGNDSPRRSDPLPPPFPDLNKNGIDDRLEGYVPGRPSPNDYDRSGTVVFPDMRTYDPGQDDEWLYFRRNMAGGGIVDAYADGGYVQGYAEGGEVHPLAGQDPRLEVIQAAEAVIEQVAAGAKPGPEEEKVLRKFVELFGDGALKQLAAAVRDRMQGGEEDGPRMIEGPGGPTDDAIPAMIDGNQPAALSDGEFVMPAAAVMGAGEGDRKAGADRLQQLSEQLAALGPAA